MSDRIGTRKWRQVLAGTGLSALIAAGAVGAASAQETAAAGTVAFVSLFGGTATIIDDGAESALGNSGARIGPGDHVVTGNRGRVAVRLDGGIRFALGPNTDLRFDAPREEADGWWGAVTVETGIIQAAFAPQPPWTQVVVSSPAAVATSEGGNFVLETDGTMTSVLSLGARVVVSGQGEGADTAAILGPGVGVDVMPGWAPYAPLRWAESRVEDFMTRGAFP